MKKTELAFQRAQRKFIKEEAKEIEKALLKKLEKAFNSGAIPDDWKEKGNRLLSKAVIDSFCQDRPYKPVTKEWLKDSNNLHKFI